MTTGRGPFTLIEAMAAQSALRDRLQMPPEAFPLSALIGMLSDEIDDLRMHDISDEDIAKLLNQALDGSITAEDIKTFYASPAERGR